MMLEEERDRIYKALEKYDSHSQYYLPEEDLNRVNYLLSCLCDFLKADAEPVRHGRWIVDDDGNIECSECGHHGVGDNYCERCGAKMNGE